MEIHDFVNCCNVRIIHGFGGTELRLSGPRESQRVDEIKHYLNRQIKIHEKVYSLLLATTNQEQRSANAALKDVGFECIGPIYKMKHPESKLFFWYYVTGWTNEQDFIEYKKEVEEKKRMEAERLHRLYLQRERQFSDDF